MRRLLLALLTGVCLWLSWPSHGLWPLAPVGIALLALATYDVGLRRGFGLGTLAGLAAFAPALHWSGIYVGELPWLALAVLESLYVGVTGALTGWLTRRRSGIRRARVRLPVPVVVAAAWVVGEWLRSTTPFGGFPWLKVAFGMADSPMLPLVRWVAAPGLTGAVALVGGLVASAILALAPSTALAAALHPRDGQGRRTARGTARAAGLVALALAIVLGPCVIPVPTDGRTTDVLAVQGNVPRAGLDFNAERRKVLDNHAAVTRQAITTGDRRGLAHPDLVVWPENASDIDPVRNPDAADVIAEASVAAGAPILVGTLRTDATGRVKNTTLVWDRTRGPVADYAKRHPVPFAEYIPYRSFFRHFSDKVDLLTTDFAAGDTIGVLDVSTAHGVVRVGLGICFEVAYDDIMRDAVTHGGQILAVQTNNATFGYTNESYQQLAISRIRAVETGRSVVHISTVGTSALITPDGRAHQQTALFTPTALRADLPLRTEITPAVRVGDLAVWISLGLLLIGAAGRAWTPRHH